MQDKNIEGTIVSIVSDKGFGFIKTDEYQKDIFFHSKSCLNIRFEQLRKGDKVIIGKIVAEEKGNSARNVSLAD